MEIHVRMVIRLEQLVIVAVSVIEDMMEAIVKMLCLV